MKRASSQTPTYTVRRSFPKGKKPYHIPLYAGMAYFCTTREEFAQVYDYMTTSDGGMEIADSCLGCVVPLTNPGNAAAYIMGVFDATLDTYTHELGHLAIEVLDRAGCPIDNHTSEAFCYLIGALAGHFEPQLVEAQKELAAELKKEAARDARAEKREEAKAIRAEQDRHDQTFKDKKAAEAASAAEAPVKPLKRTEGKGGKRDRS